MNLFALELPPIGAGYDAPFSASSRFPSSSYPQTTRNDIERACGPNRLGRISESLRVFLARMTWVARILYIDTKDVLKLLDCGRLGRQAAGHSWSALRVAKSCRKTAQRPRCCSKLKQQLCIQNGTRAHYLNCLQRGRVRRGKEAQVIGLASQSDGQKSDGQTDRQTDRSKQGR
jgi:hypothetical protein